MLDGIFNYDNKFFRAVNKLADLVILSFCWLISCIPIFTIGAASSALYSAVHKSIRRGKGYVWSGYWSAFRSDFKQATKAWLIMLLIIIVVTSDILITTQMLKAGMSMGNLSIVFIVMECIIVAWYAYTFAYIARFEQTTKLTAEKFICDTDRKPPMDISCNSNTFGSSYDSISDTFFYNNSSGCVCDNARGYI